MVFLKKKTFEEFAEELASKSAVPGGGSVAALSGFLGAALVSMVCRLTIGKKDYEEYEDEVKSVLVLSEELRERLLGAADEDCRAYGKVMDAFALPKGTDKEKTLRKNVLELAFREACESPRKTARLCLEVLRLCARIAGKVNVNAATDLGVGAHQALAGLEGATMNVFINLLSIRDEEYGDEVRDEMEANEEEGRILKATVMREVIYPGGIV